MKCSIMHARRAVLILPRPTYDRVLNYKIKQLLPEDNGWKHYGHMVSRFYQTPEQAAEAVAAVRAQLEREGIRES